MAEKLPQIRHTVEEVCEVLEQTHGMVAIAAKSLGCTPWAIYKRAKDHPIIKETIKSAREEMIDLAESKLRLAILNGESWAIALTLKTLGKGRGYVERMEWTGEDGKAIKTELYLPQNSRDKQLESGEEEIVEGEIVDGD